MQGVGGTRRRVHVRAAGGACLASVYVLRNKGVGPLAC
jgi:hypothetical protein